MPIDPLTISAIIGGAQTLGGLAQTMYGKSKAEGLKRPTFEIPKELQEKLTLQQIRAMQGMDDATKQEYLKNIDRMSFFTNRVASRAGVPQALATTYQQKADAIGRLAAAEDEAKARRMSEYYGGLQDMAEAKTKQFDINQMQPYLQQAKASQALIGAGLQNLYGGLSSLGKTASQSSLANTLEETGQKTTNELKDYLKAALVEAEKSKAATTTENPADKTVPSVDETEVTLSAPDETETTDIISPVVPQQNTSSLNTMDKGSTAKTWSEGLFDNLVKQGIASSASSMPGLSEAMAEKPIVKPTEAPKSPEITVTPGDLGKGGFADLDQQAQTPSVSGGFGGGVGGGGASASLKAPKEAIELRDTLPGWIKSMMLNSNYPEKEIHLKYNELKDSGYKEEAENFINEQFPQIYQNINDFIKDYQQLIVDKGWGAHNENQLYDVSDYMLKNIKTPLKTSLLMKYGTQEMKDKATELYNSFNWRDEESVKNYEKAIDKIFNKSYKKLEDFKSDYNKYLKENKLKPEDLDNMFN